MRGHVWTSVCTHRHTQPQPHSRAPGKTSLCPSHPTLSLGSHRKMGTHLSDASCEGDPSHADRTQRMCSPGERTAFPHHLHPSLHHHICYRIIP